MFVLLNRPPTRRAASRRRFQFGLLSIVVHWPLRVVGPLLSHLRDVAVERLMAVLITIAVAASVLVLRPGHQLSGDTIKEVASVAVVAWTAVPTLWRFLLVRRTRKPPRDADNDEA